MESKELQKKIDQIVLATSKAYNLPSISFSAMVDGKEYHSAVGCSDLEEKIEANEHSVYSIGSASKAFIATCLNILADEGKLDLDLPVKTYLPWFRMYDPYMTENLTTRDALSHRTGMPRHDLTWLNRPEASMEDHVRGLAFLPPAFKPRYRFHYQNHMFVLATVLTEVLSGMPWQQFVKERIFDKLGMNETWATGDMVPDTDRRKARPYGQKDGINARVPYNYAKSVGGCGTIYSSTSDMLKWLDFRLNGNENVLSKARLDDMHTPHMVMRAGELTPIQFPEVELMSYCQGWFSESYRGNRVVHHGGTINGFKSLQGFVPGKNIVFSALANLNSTQSVISVSYKFLDAVLGLSEIDWDANYIAAVADMTAAGKKEVEALLAGVGEEKPLADAKPYAGKYVHQAYGVIEVAVQDDGKPALMILGTAVPLRYKGGDAFILMGADMVGSCPDVLFARNGDIMTAVEVQIEKEAVAPIRFIKI